MSDCTVVDMDHPEAGQSAQSSHSDIVVDLLCPVANCLRIEDRVQPMVDNKSIWTSHYGQTSLRSRNWTPLHAAFGELLLYEDLSSLIR